MMMMMMMKMMGRSEEHTGQQLVKKQRTTVVPAATVGFAGYDGDQNHKQLVQATSADDKPVKKSSKYHGVSRHRWTGKYEAHLWDKLSWNATRKKKGRQVYLGAYREEEVAARAYDLASLKFWGASTFTNFPIWQYEKDIRFMQTVSKEEYLASLRRNSSGFSRGVSKYRGVSRHHKDERWEARIGRIFGDKYLYLGTYNTQEEAARAYDIAAIEYRGINAMTNFNLSTYTRWLKPEPIPQMPVLEPPTGKQYQTALFVANYLDREESKPPLFNNQHFTVDYLNPPHKQELPKTNVPVSSSSNSSTKTALGLLFQSSMFRELVEKNSNVIEVESVKNDTKNDAKNQQVEIGSHEVQDSDLFYGGISDMIPSDSSSSGESIGDHFLINSMNTNI